MYILKTIISYITAFIVTLQSMAALPVFSTNFKFEAEASVFETGDGMYTLIWSTTRPGSGFVTYTYDGRDYTVYDEIGGVVQSLDTIHSVRVPKQHLDHNTYTYHSQLVVQKEAYSAVTGKTIDSDPVDFGGYSGEEAINALVIADVHNRPLPAKMAADNFEKPSFLILNGDITSSMVKKNDFINILKYTYLFSEGKIPVAYARGNHEPRGEFAAEMPDYFRISTGGMYYTFNYGPLWAVVLDSGEDKEDSHPEYSGLVNFRPYIARETGWLSNVKADTDAEYRIAIVHKPSMDDLDGENWFGMLSDLGIEAALSGHLHRLDLHYYEGSTPYYRFVTGPEEGYDMTATMFTFSTGNIRAKTYNWAGISLADENFPIPRPAQ